VPQKNTIFGVGPKLVAATAAYFLLVLWLGALAGLPPIAADPYWLRAAGLLLLAVAAVLWLILARTVVRIYKLGRLYRQGFYAYCRHPLYANYILLAIPGFGLLANSWAALTAIPVALLIFRRLIREEERGLVAAFGAEYEQYRREVNALFPKL
jgi:protein-S-isoprenylcysteine O-methyltransferase Ste14